MTLEQLIKALTPDVYENLKNAVAIGKWPDGRALVNNQRELCMEAIMHYEMTHNVPEDQRVGYIESQCQSSKDNDTQTLTLQ
jgi:uncharacterized protein YeaC (DUF1315 family)